MKTNRIGIFDAGTGIRDLGNDLVASGHEQDQIFIVFTHFHWDHIQGFPFFTKAYDPKQKINIFTMGKGKNNDEIKGLFTTLMQSEYFPVPFDKMGASFDFMHPDVLSGIFGPLQVKITANRHNHPGGAYGYRIEREGKVLVFCTDIEHGDEIDQNVVELCKDADLLIHDAQYTSEELKVKKGWGHSSYEQAIQVAEMAGVKQLAITHHDPDHDDEFLLGMEKQCQERFPNCVLAREKMEIEIK
jgi:phosphoribosyl 1,2-cyclic phosphodiesterase